MPLLDFVCASSHVTEKLIRGERPAQTRCEECGGPAFRKDFGYATAKEGRLSSEVPLAHYHEAALEAEDRFKRTDDPSVKAAYPERIWHAAKVRAEAQMQSGAKSWTPERVWNQDRV